MAVVGATSAVATTGLPEWEAEAFEVLNGGPGILEPILWAPMQLGSLVAPFLVGAVAWWRLRQWRPAVGAVVAGVASWQLAKAVKSAIERGRPFELADTFARLSGTPYEGLGFVSGHSAVAFSLAAVLSPHLGRRQRWLAYSVAAIVGLARIQVSAHLPLDVVGGAALGYAVGWGWNAAVGPGDEAPGESGQASPQDAVS